MLPGREQKLAISKVIEIFSLFAAFDSKMQISTALTLLNIAMFEDQEGGITTREIEKRTGMPSGTGSRNVMYWAQGYKEMPNSGYGMIEAITDPVDRRRKILKLTDKGNSFFELLTATAKEGQRRVRERADDQIRSERRLSAPSPDRRMERARAARPGALREVEYGEMASNAPDVGARKPVRTLAIGPHVAILVRNPPPMGARDEHQISTKYLWALAVLKRERSPDLFARPSPIYIVTLERAPGGLPMLCGFDRSGQHTNFGAAPDLLDEDRFIERSAQLVRGILGISDVAQDRSYSLR